MFSACWESSVAALSTWLDAAAVLPAALETWAIERETSSVPRAASRTFVEISSVALCCWATEPEISVLTRSID
ncbi:hypothetical protein [Rhabdaerophilum sp. SD176]|uniref:hypothetical protein n=1 Tax=Rhabdaerophilum sp. SD176 TaxID=2983548 RepID=UPI0024DFBFAF|nr:hypothetical protein [Rhabdaerophilum sp. SD176]